MDRFLRLRAHAEWVVRLRETLYGDGVIDSSMAADDEACALGRWLSDMESESAAIPEFEAARDAHRCFHRRAAYCVQLVHAGRRRQALAETEEGGELRRRSMQLLRALQRLNRAAHALRRRPRPELVDPSPGAG